MHIGLFRTHTENGAVTPGELSTEAPRPAGRRWRHAVWTAVAVLAAQVVAFFVGVAGGHASVPPEPPDTLRQKIVTLAQQELNNSARNHPSGLCNYYTGVMVGRDDGCDNSTYGYGNWCADFNWYIWKNAGAALSRKSSWADSFRQYPDGTAHLNGSAFFPSHARGGTYVPVAGDAVMFDWDPDPIPGGTSDANDNGTPDIDHVGTVVAVHATSITVVSGNAGTPGWTRQDTYGFNDPNLDGYTIPLPK